MTEFGKYSKWRCRLYVNTLNVLDILNYDKFIVTQEAVKLVEEVYD